MRYMYRSCSYLAKHESFFFEPLNVLILCSSRPVFVLSSVEAIALMNYHLCEINKSVCCPYCGE